jgi:hypothetical protein
MQFMSKKWRYSKKKCKFACENEETICIDSQNVKDAVFDHFIQTGSRVKNI